MNMKSFSGKQAILITIGDNMKAIIAITLIHSSLLILSHLTRVKIRCSTNTLVFSVRVSSRRVRNYSGSSRQAK